ncbi:hypothetical protein Q4493_05395 [Colwellia sp. 1_MG-2023]|uniref:hypothetical protein n=1 Tax=Colwellia sp. 1_MG-2023 TaxID=3062649 RepID=UPI0026E48251|nr:hypothetical protein [Colwellia sp. 1_MG-2023]MDO6445206.1 hypothetical protein [Colwellia sp. 1_MG-2023]
MMKITVSLVLLALFFMGCSQATQKQSTEKSLENTTQAVIEKSEDTLMKDENTGDVKYETSKWQQAKIKYVNVEGGFYGLITHSGDKLLPLNLDKAFKQDGAVVNIQGEKMENMMTIQQWGKPFKITNIKLIKAGRVKVPVNQ